MKLFFNLLIIIIILGSCQDSKKAEQEYFVVEEYRKDSLKEEKKSKPIVTRPGYKQYINEQYHITLEYPKDWNFYESAPDDSLAVINFFRIQDTYSQNYPILLHAAPELTQVSFYPRGLGTEFPQGLSRQIEGYHEDLPISFNINKEESMVFLLENQQVYGYFLKPSSPPPGWNKEGFIYAQIAVDGFYSTCIDPQTGTEKLIQDCDPSAGDIARKYGNLNPGSRRAVLNISSSMNFFEGNTDLLVISDIIQVISPQPYQQIGSPIAIMGEAAKTWFNKSEFPVILTDAEYQIMARGNAKSIGKSTNQDFIPFELSLDYKNPLHDNGYIILRRANTSGKPEQDRSIIIPITFSSVY